MRLRVPPSGPFNSDDGLANRVVRATRVSALFTPTDTETALNWTLADGSEETGIPLGLGDPNGNLDVLLNLWLQHTAVVDTATPMIARVYRVATPANVLLVEFAFDVLSVADVTTEDSYQLHAPLISLAALTPEEIADLTLLVTLENADNDGTQALILGEDTTIQITQYGSAN